MLRNPLTRFALAVAALTVSAALATAAGASAKVYRVGSVASNGGVYVFHLPRVAASHVVSARLQVAGRQVKLNVRSVRKAIPHRVLRARYVAVVSSGHRVSRARSRHAVLVLIVSSKRQKHPGLPPRTGAGGGSGGPSVFATSCGGPFGVGNWPGACWRPYSASSPFNQEIPANARLMANSAAIVQRVLGFGQIGNFSAGASDATDDWNHPTYYPQPTDPVFTLHCTQSWGRCDIEGMQVRVPDAARPASGGDGHMTIVDQQSGWEYDLWQVQSKPRGGGTLSFSWGGRTRIDGDGLGSGGVAAGYGNLAGIIRGPELAAGQINHALFMVIKCSNGQSVYPASGTGSKCSDPTSAPPMGARFQLAMSDAQIDALPVPAWKKAILRAMAHYGMYFGDTGGGTWGVETESSATYTSFGVQDPIVTYAQQAGVPTWNGDYVFDMKSGVDWAQYLRVVDPCVAQGAC